MKKKTIEKTELEKRLEAETAEEDASQKMKNVEESASEEDENLPNLEVLPEVDVPALLSERDALKEQLLRARADFDNYRKRVLRDDARLRKRAAECIVRDLLPVLDNLDRALEHANDDSAGLAQGVEMVRSQFFEVLVRHGLDVIPSVGHGFDPNVHEAVTCVTSEEVPPNHVVQELQKGYRLGGYVLRPAKVVVNAVPPAAPGPYSGAPLEAPTETVETQDQTEQENEQSDLQP